MSNREESIAQPGGWRRPLVGVLAVALLCGGLILRLSTEESSGQGKFGAGTLIRLSIAFGALWLAWPSLQRPARWLPPGMAVVILVGIGALVVQPRLLPAMLPAIGLMFTLSVLIRMFRG